MDFYGSLGGMVTLELTSADPAAALETVCSADIPIYDAQEKDELHVTFRIHRSDVRKARQIFRRRGDELCLIQRQGVFWTLKSLISRPVLVLGASVYLLLMLYLPSRVFFVRVVGNETVPANRILESAGECGIRFGASRREVRSERVKNALLEAVPELQWAGVNTSGCVATISVRERTIREETAPELILANIVSDRDSIILSCTATRGNLLCAPGQAVKAGQLLISGYTDSGLLIRATGARGEIFGRTIRDISAVSPSVYLQKSQSGQVKRCISLIVGKKRINLWKDSGIWDTTCGRIYEEKYITLPGGFCLPLGLAVEEYDLSPLAEGNSSLPQEALTVMADRYLISQMIAGQILRRELLFTEEPGLCRLEGEYVCTEMIGRVQRESIGEYNGEDH